VATITAIERLRFKRRARLYLDGEPALTLATDIIAAEGLAPGQAMSDAALAALRERDQRQQALDGALRLLSQSPRSEREIRQRLRRRGIDADAVDAAVARMRELGYLDDAAFAKSYVDSRQAATPRSRRSLAFELGRRGIDKAAAAAALASVSDLDAAYAAASRRLRALAGLDRQTFARRLGAFLAGRGFGYGVARATIERCWAEIGAGDDDTQAGD
jgi:regulatory protein